MLHLVKLKPLLVLGLVGILVMEYAKAEPRRRRENFSVDIQETLQKQDQEQSFTENSTSNHYELENTQDINLHINSEPSNALNSNNIDLSKLANTAMVNINYNRDTRLSYILGWKLAQGLKRNYQPMRDLTPLKTQYLTFLIEGLRDGLKNMRDPNVNYLDLKFYLTEIYTPQKHLSALTFKSTDKEETFYKIAYYVVGFDFAKSLDLSEFIEKNAHKFKFDPEVFLIAVQDNINQTSSIDNSELKEGLEELRQSLIINDVISYWL